ncbi:MAG: ribonuclease P protein component [Myxococcales bacterium]|nr:ribonuclease P protein component [Myxococcales bacterium]
MLRRADFLVTTGEGRRVDGAHFLVFIRDRNDGRGARLGITVTRKVGNAVIRNRIKRLVREWFRSREAQLGSRDLVMIAHRGVARDLGLAAVEQDLEPAMRQLEPRPVGPATSPSE